MAMTINTNVVSINSQRNLSLSGNSLGTTMQRLSSGLRVNSAKDDAAGLAIAERMNAQSRGLAVAARNANDGISLAQTTEGALGKVGDMLQRMRELAVQASNATNSTEDRKALQAEVSQLTAEIDRVAKTTSFNGTKVLDGSFTGGVFQVGSGAGDNITVGGTTKATANGLGSATYGASSINGRTDSISDFAKEVTSGLTIQVGTGAAVDLGTLTAAGSETERLGQVVSAINAKSADTGVTAFLTQDGKGGFTVDVRSTSNEKVTFGAGFTTASTGVSAAGTTPAAISVAAASAYENLTTHSAAYDKAQFETALNTLTTDPKISKFSDQWSAALDAYNGTPNGANAVLLTTAVKKVVDNYNLAVTAQTTFAAIGSPTTTQQGTYGAALETLSNVAASEKINFAQLTVKEGAAAIQRLEAAAGFSGLNIKATGKTTGIDKLDISTQAGAWEALKQVDSAIDQVNAARGELGALQTRFEKSIENIDIQNENITAARGRIVDADFATETANLSRAQILQQAGTAMVAQANQLPQQVLSLLQ
nr:flagellin [uncultured Comamonas sp.]